MTRLKLRTDRLQWVELDGELVALDESALAYLSANESATLLWRELSVGTTRAELTRLLAERFELDDEQAQVDVDRFLTDLRERTLLLEDE